VSTYIVLFGFTQQGIKNIKESPTRIQSAKKSFQALGAEVKEFFAVMGMGEYDTMFIVEAPNDETIAKATLAIGSLGYVRTNTHRVFKEDEFRKMIAAMP
jgi:uncharacterized protein with GYD domain